MDKKEVKELFNYLEQNYSNFEYDKSKFDYWFNELQQYDNDDVRERLKDLMSDERYNYQPPFLETIVKGLTKKSGKLDFSQLVYYCKFCRRGFNDRKELDNHEDRCRSIKYIERQYKRFNLEKIDNAKKRELYELSEEEFDRQYKLILKYVMQQTTDESEKTRISFIFNPPSQEQAKAFLGNS